MWEEVLRAACDDSGVGQKLVGKCDSLDVVYCQTWRYDDSAQRLSDRLGIKPARQCYSGIGGTTPQVLLSGAAERILRGETDIAFVVGAEALDTQRRFRKRDEKFAYSFPPAEKHPFPWEAPFHPSEVAHEVFQPWLTFAMFDNARRAHRGTGLDQYRRELGEQWHRFTKVAASNPQAWFPLERSVGEIITPSATNRLVGYPYTKYMVSIMDVDMAAGVVITSHERADVLGVPADQRIYLRGWCFATDPVYVAEHPDLWRSPAMEDASAEALRGAGISIDDVAHFDLYSCFASSVNFARDALGIGTKDSRPLTVTGGLPYHGGAGSNYVSHSIAEMTRVLRRDPGSFGLVSGVGMHMTKHVFGIYSTTPGPVAPPSPVAACPTTTVIDTYEGPATVATYSVVHGRDGLPEWGIAVCDTPSGERCYAKLRDADLLASAEEEELVGKSLVIAIADGSVNVGRLP